VQTTLTSGFKTSYRASGFTFKARADRKNAAFTEYVSPPKAGRHFVGGLPASGGSATPKFGGGEGVLKPLLGGRRKKNRVISFSEITLPLLEAIR
jgi:hypothetical protein